MTNSEIADCPPPPSLLACAVELRLAVDALDAGGPLSELHAAIRRAMTAVERELGGTSGGNGLLANVATTEPRLRPAIERLEVGLAEMLIALWETKRGTPDTSTPVPDLVPVARRLRRLADQAVDLLHQSMLPLGGGG